MAAARIAATLLLAALSSGLIAQEPAQSYVTVRVTDATGAVIPGAWVNIGSSNLKPDISAKTDSVGIADFEAAPGSYIISVSAPGFVRWSKNIVLGGDSSQSIVVTATLTLGGGCYPCLSVVGPEVPLLVESVNLSLLIPRKTLHNLALVAKPLRRKLW